MLEHKEAIMTGLAIFMGLACLWAGIYLLKGALVDGIIKRKVIFKKYFYDYFARIEIISGWEAVLWGIVMSALGIVCLSGSLILFGHVFGFEVWPK